jgi:hypothetical protein
MEPPAPDSDSATRAGHDEIEGWLHCLQSLNDVPGFRYGAD